MLLAGSPGFTQPWQLRKPVFSACSRTDGACNAGCVAFLFAPTAHVATQDVVENINLSPSDEGDMDTTEEGTDQEVEEAQETTHMCERKE